MGQQFANCESSNSCKELGIGRVDVYQKGYDSSGTLVDFNRDYAALFKCSENPPQGVSYGDGFVRYSLDPNGCGYLPSSCTISGTLTSAVGSDSQTVSMSTAITSIEYTLTTTCSDTLNASIAWTPSTPNGVSMSFSNNVATISGTPTGTATGTYNYTLTASNTAGTASASFSGSLTVSSSSSTAYVLPIIGQTGSLEFYNGNLYVGVSERILKIDSSANVSTYLGLGGEIDIDIDVVGKSDFITGLQFDANGAMYFGSGNVVRKLHNNQITTIYSDGVGTGGIVINSNGEVFIAMCCADPTMRKIDVNGNVSNYFSQGGSVYGLDIKNDEIYMAFRSGEIKTVSSLGSTVNVPVIHNVSNVVDFLTSIKVDQNNNIYILNSSNNQDGKLIKVDTNGVETEILSNLWSTRGLDFDDSGNLYVADYGRIHKVAPDGTVSEFINTRD